jgi:hypothetical protein
MNVLRFITKRNCLLGLAILFILMSIWIASVPYEPMEWDLADATTNVIWVEKYSNGVYEIPYEEWDYGMTQSSVVEHNGQYVVVNEKGPGFVWMLVPFHVLGLEFLFGPVMVAIAVFSTFMLGFRLSNWKVGFMAAVIVLVNLSVIAMWHRYYWTDAATMHLLVLSIWLLIESNYWFNGKNLDPKNQNETEKKDILLSFGLAFLSGLTFSASVSTRHPVALVIIAMFLYIFVFYLIRSWPELRNKDIKGALNKGRGLIFLLFFTIGMMCILVPLMQYNTEYFGGPFNSGYDATPLTEFNETSGATPRNQTGNWFDTFGQGISNTLDNTIKLIPILILRMPALVLAPLGIWLLRKKKIVLALLLPWIFIAFYTYLSLSFVDKYANPRIYFDVIWEPRYFMPTIPAIAILGAIGIEFIAFQFWPKLLNGIKQNNTKRKMIGIVIALLILAVIALPGIVPAADHFKDPGAQRPHHPKPVGVQRIITDQLIREPERYVQNFVLVERAEIVGEIREGWKIRSPDSREPGNVTVRLVEWPPSEVPLFNIGNEVDVQGLFQKARNPESPDPYFINVKWDTKDFIRLSKE